MKHIYGFYTIITSNKVKDEERVSFVRMSGSRVLLLLEPADIFIVNTAGCPAHELFEANVR